MDLKFYKGATRPSGIPAGSLWFNTAKKRIELITSSTASEVYGSNVADASVSGNTLTITKIDGSKVTLTNTDTHYTSALTIGDGTTNAVSFDQASAKSLKFAGSGATSVSASSGQITISSTNTDTKVTSVDNHYTPTANSNSALSASASGASAGWSIDVVKGVSLSRDAKGHVTGLSVTSGKIPANPNTDTKVTSVGNHYTPSGGTATTGVIINSITKDAAGHITAIGTASGLSADKITSGTIDIARLPKGALERLFVVDTEAKAMAADVQEGDTVKVTGNSNKMYFCVKDPKATGATFATCFTEYTAGSATSVPWSGVTDKPSSYTPSSHTHDDRYYTETEMDSKLLAKVNADNAGINAAINLLSTGSAVPTDNDYYISQYVDGGTTETTYHRRPVSALFTYIKGKLARVATSGSYNDLSNKPTIPSGTITGITMNGSSKGTSGVINLGTVLTGGSQTSTSTADGGSNVYTFSDGSTITVKNGTKGSQGKDGSNGTSVTISSLSQSTAAGGTSTVTFSDGKTLSIKNGTNGTNGSNGTNGTNGTSAMWFTGTAVTGSSSSAVSVSVSDSKAGDMYLNTSTGYVYLATAANTWVYKCNISGPRGYTGSPGSTGSDGKIGLQCTIILSSAVTTIGAQRTLQTAYHLNRSASVGEYFMALDKEGNYGLYKVTKTDSNFTYAELQSYVALKASGSSYTLPVATSSTLGGVKIGSGLSVTSAGVVSTNDSTIISAVKAALSSEEWTFTLEDNSTVTKTVYLK